MVMVDDDDDDGGGGMESGDGREPSGVGFRRERKRGEGGGMGGEGGMNDRRGCFRLVAFVEAIETCNSHLDT
jgi:hypothetical protein